MSKNKVDGNENFEVKLKNGEILKSKLDDNTDLITTAELSKKWLETSMYNFNNNYNQYSAYLKESSLCSTTIEDSELVTLAINPQSDLAKVLRINDYARFYINKDDLIGKVYETIESNVNTEIKLSFKDFDEQRNKNIQLDKAKALINKFNEQINIKSLLRKCVPIAYSEGNYPVYLRKNNDNYIVDHYPLGVVEVSDYQIAGEPYLLVNINELVSRLQKVNKKDRKGKSLFFENIETEIKNNYPIEIYEGYKNKDQYVKLDIKNSGIVRLNNMNRKYGVTPIFRTFKAVNMLETFEATDKINAKSKGKKIILQTLRKELMGEDGSNQAFEEMSYAHHSLMTSWRNEIVVYTSPAWVESVSYVEPKIEGIGVESTNHYRNKIMTTLGIAFLSQDSKATYSTSQISIKELMKMINKITEQLEEILKKWYRVVLDDNGIDIMYCPDVKVIDSEMLEMDIKLELATFLYSTLNCSLETAYNTVGYDLKDEKIKREKENENLLEDVFSPRLTNFTNNGDSLNNKDSKAGKPTTKDVTKKDKSLKDQERRGTTT